MNTTPINTKKSWTKPQLLVLVRNNPEEAVLSSCKGYTVGGSPSDSDLGCVTDSPFCEICAIQVES